MSEILAKVESVLSHSFNIPISFRLELYFMQAKVIRSDEGLFLFFLSCIEEDLINPY